MLHTRLRVLLVLGAAAIALTTLGCFKANLEIDLKPDLAMDIAAEMRVPSEFMTEEMNPADAAGLDEVTVGQVDGMHVIHGTRRLGPGETLAAEETDRGMEIMRQKVARRLSTRYIFVAEFAGNPMPSTDAPVATDDEQAKAGHEEALAPGDAGAPGQPHREHRERDRVVGRVPAEVDRIGKERDRAGPDAGGDLDHSHDPHHQRTAEGLAQALVRQPSRANWPDAGILVEDTVGVGSVEPDHDGIAGRA